MDTEKKILVVDDDPDIRESLKTILTAKGYVVRTAKNGIKALSELLDYLPDIMILDIMMANDTEGFDLAFELKHSQEYKNIPIILMTGFMQKVHKEGPEGFQHILGEAWPAEWMFEKPVDNNKLLEKISEILKTR